MQEFESAVQEAFAQLDVEVVAPADSSGAARGDLIVDPEGGALVLSVKRVAFVNDQLAERLAVEGKRYNNTIADRGTTAVLFVVADQVTRTARATLARAGVGYFDLRGRLSLRAPGLVVEADVEPQERAVGRRDPLAGKAGLEVASALLLNPQQKPSVRSLSRELRRSVSTVSVILAALRESRYIEGNTVSATRLFWALADRWHQETEYLLELPPLGQDSLVAPLRLELDQVGSEPGWALRGTAAAAVLGAPVAVRADQPLDFFVPDKSVVHRARRLLGVAPSGELARCTVAAAPVAAVCMARSEPADSYFEWPTTHPLFVALDLAQDAGRGQEILADWTPENWPRVW
ncbi:hypothetical protein GCM10009804_29090 [Kribbella hippodromi]|uniref:Transcriptional regulator n=1 Tax=Kribbella hippodromi TaxID=434347 RepID=A0ABP4P4V0_9ACTN